LAAVDEQNAQTLQFELENASRQMSVPSVSPKPCRPEPLVRPQIIEPEDSSVETSALSPPPSATSVTPPSSLLIPTIITVDLTNDDDGPLRSYGIEIPQIGGLSLPNCGSNGLLAVPRYSPSFYSSSDGESSSCSTPGLLSPGQMTPGLFSTEQISQAMFTPIGCRSPSSLDAGSCHIETDCLMCQV